MAVCEFHLNQGNALGLHGLSDDHTAWLRWFNIDAYVRGLPLIVVMPSGERGFYTDAKDIPKAAFETNIVRDIVDFVDRTFQTIPTREGRVIAGLSMGGYGAVKLAIKHPEMFCAAVSHSGAVGYGRRNFSGQDSSSQEWRPVFGEHPALRMDCGVDDFLLDENRALHTHLDALGIPHEYEEHPGGHTWAYWNDHIRETLTFFKRVLKIGIEEGGEAAGE